MKNYPRSLAVMLLFILSGTEVFARGGGGGSGGGGGGGGGFSSGGSGGGSGSSSPLDIYITLALWALVIIGVLYQRAMQKKKEAETKKALEKAAASDPAWNDEGLTSSVTDIFYRFQKDWSNFDTDSMKEYVTEEYFKRMVLELNVLKNEGRQNRMENVILNTLSIESISDKEGKEEDTFIAEIHARADDSLVDTVSNKILYTDTQPFIEYWELVRSPESQRFGWKLNSIRQQTEDVALREQAIVEFAAKNNFYYDSDFGWLMMPNKGVIFRQNDFVSADINNHVVGYYHGQIVEFYTFIPKARKNTPTNYVVAQMVLPIHYEDILVRRKRRFFNFAPSGLRRIETESNEFERKFCLFAHPNDQIHSFELLSPDFMEKMYELPFELNIEIVGNFLYFYAKGRKGVDYPVLMDILSRAFTEMKM